MDGQTRNDGLLLSLIVFYTAAPVRPKRIAEEAHRLVWIDYCYRWWSIGVGGSGGGTRVGLDGGGGGGGTLQMGGRCPEASRIGSEFVG